MGFIVRPGLVAMLKTARVWGEGRSKVESGKGEFL
jgi:hypothetical protein